MAFPSIPNKSVALFGTCGHSKWRDAFIETYKEKDINFYNPNKEGWSPEDAQVEKEHMASDNVLVLVITSETFGTASLGEIGFAIYNASVANKALRNPERYVVIYIDPKVDASLVKDNPQAAKESNNTRAIIMAHLSKIDLPYVFISKTLEDALDVTLKFNALLT